MTSLERKPSLLISLIPVAFLLGALTLNMLWIKPVDSVAGPIQLILILSGFVAALLGRWQGIGWDEMIHGVGKGLHSTTPAILILLLIGALAGTWMVSGIVPTMIYYGLKLLHPSYFLAATVVLCAVVSLTTGSSWSTSATLGIALVAVGQTMGIAAGPVAGAVISGAYFGDKISPLSDTTNLAPAMAGTDLFTHIRYMLLTTLPSLAITLVFFVIWGLGYETDAMPEAVIQETLQALDATFVISPWFLLVPMAVIGMIALRIPAIPSILTGALLGAVVAWAFQPAILAQMAGVSTLDSATGLRSTLQALTGTVQVPIDHPLLADLLQSRGMGGMLNTVWIIVAAMFFGGVLERCGHLERISNALLSAAKSTFSLIATTVGTCLTVNVTASDQYLAIVVPGRMYKEAYAKKGLAPENLSRTLEDSGTVTSALIPWNSCGAYQSGALGVATGDYWMYAIFNWVSPLMTLLFAGLGIKIKTLQA
jgi:NhaC family Na+:H+ antiporter